MVTVTLQGLVDQSYSTRLQTVISLVSGDFVLCKARTTLIHCAGTNMKTYQIPSTIMIEKNEFSSAIAYDC